MGKTKKQQAKKAARDQQFRAAVAKKKPTEKRAYPAGAKPRTSAAKGPNAIVAKPEEDTQEQPAADSSEAVESSAQPGKKKKLLNVWDYTGDEHMRVYKKNLTQEEIKAENEEARKRTLFERKRVRDRVST